MYNLAEIQQAFQDYILAEDLDIEKAIISTSKVLASERLEIYREGYYLRLLEVLESDYSVLKYLLGCEKFDQLGRSYIDAYTSSYRSVRWFGKYLADYLKQKNNLIKTSERSETLWQSELALFEWLLTEAFDAPNSSVLSIEQMELIPAEKWSGMRFKLQPSLRKFSTAWNIIELWQAYNKNKHQNLNQKKIKPQKLNPSENFLIWRKEYQIKFCSLNIEQDYMYTAQYLKTLIADGVIAECIVE